MEDSLRRLNTDVIDLYQAHRPDPETSYEETLDTFDRLVKAGKIRAFGCSNFDARQLAEAKDSARINGLPAYQTLQPEYNLFDRGALRRPAARPGDPAGAWASSPTTAWRRAFSPASTARRPTWARARAAAA